MLNKIIVLLLIINITFKIATAKPLEEDESITEKLNYKYEHGKVFLNEFIKKISI